jgi:uncharacterized cupredoxin-like copper-binding protein
MTRSSCGRAPYHATERLAKWLALALTASISAPAVAHGDAAHGTAGAAAITMEQKPWGIAGERTSAQRTIEIGMTDEMRFVPERVEVRLGEIIRFVHRNDGKVLHEFVLGTKAELDKHAAMMKKFPGMEHDEPYMAHVPPGETREIVWTFNRAGTFDFACLIPGHYDAGMVGSVVVAPPVSR